jgi:hypothetical protein
MYTSFFSLLSPSVLLWTSVAAAFYLHFAEVQGFSLGLCLLVIVYCDMFMCEFACLLVSQPPMYTMVDWLLSPVHFVDIFLMTS